jgi:hypothetical protein
MPSFTPRRAAALAAGALASAAIAGPAAATEPVPQYVAGNPTCADVQGSEHWREYKIDPVPAGLTPFVDGLLTGSVNVDSARVYFDFLALPGVDAVIVKGGPNSNVYRYSPDAAAGSGLHAPINPNNGTPYGLSHISFCHGGEDGGTPSTPGTPGTPGGTSGGGTSGGTSGGGTPSSKPTDPTPPTGQVAGEQIGAGQARLSGISGCAKHAFTARVRGRFIKSVVFKVDGRRVKTVRSASAKATAAAVSVNPARYGKGTHRLTARVTFNPASHTRAHTLALAFQRCARAAVAPKFAG